MSIYVGNLSYDVTDEDLKSVFAEYGSVGRVHLPSDRETGRPRGFAFVEMSSETEETAAIEALDGAEWMGRDMKVNKAKPRENRGGGGSYGGGGGGSAVVIIIILEVATKRLSTSAALMTRSLDGPGLTKSWLDRCSPKR